MTANETSTMKHDVEADRERLAEEAFGRIRKGNHWRDWTYLAQGFEVGRNKAMRETHTNQPIGRGYNEAFGRWMNARPWARGIDKATRNHLLWIADHLVEIEAWRETLAANQRDKWNHPTTVKKAYEAAMKHKVAQEKGETVRSPMAEIKASLIQAQEEAHKWQRRAEEGGSLFDLRRDTAQDIARVLVKQLSPAKAEQIARAIRQELKQQKPAHAGVASESPRQSAPEPEADTPDDDTTEVGEQDKPDFSGVPTEQLVAELEAGCAAFEAHAELRRITEDLPPEPVASSRRKEVVAGKLRYGDNRDQASITREEWDAFRSAMATPDVNAKIEAAHDQLT